MRLDEIVENPDNPSVGTDEDMKRLEGKLTRVPDGLKAMRIGPRETAKMFKLDQPVYAEMCKKGLFCHV